MREWPTEKLAKVLRIGLQITFVGGVCVTAFFWWILWAWFPGYFATSPRYYYACVALITPCGVATLYILWQLIALVKTIGNRNPFALSNVRGLRRIAGSSFIISALFSALMFFRVTILTFGIAYIFLIAGFCFIVLARLFRQAVAYKDENDLTV